MVRPFLMYIQKIFIFYSFTELILQKHSLVTPQFLRYNKSTEAHLN